MGMPQNALSSQTVTGTFFEPDDRFHGPFEDYERGGIALYDVSEGLMYQNWHLTYESDDQSPNYGEFTLTPETTGAPVMVHTVAGVKSCGLAFDQNMFPFICYELLTGECEYWWYDTSVPAQITSSLPAGSVNPACCLDNKSEMQFDTSDILLFYFRGGSFYYREQRDRYTVEYLLREATGNLTLDRVGMTTVNRVQMDAGSDSGVFLSTVVRNLLSTVGVAEVNTQEIDAIIVRGFLCGKQFTVAEALRSLQRSYFFDIAEIDGEFVCVLRGHDPIQTIYQTDMVKGTENYLVTAREQEVEYPRKLNLSYQSSETDYTPTTATAERFSSNLKVVSETSVEVPINFLPDDAAQVADIMLKIAWMEQNANTKFSLSEKFSYLTPTDVVSVEVEPDIFLTMRIQAQEMASVVSDYQLVADRKYVYESTATGADAESPETPPAQLPGPSTWEAMDITPIDVNHDTLHYYVAGYGDSAAWRGGLVQREIAGEWFAENGTIAAAATLGQVQEVLPTHPVGIDTTNTLLVSASDTRLITVTQSEFDAGANYCIVDNEIMQFRDVAIEGNNYRLSYLNRGALNTTPIQHELNERFVRFNAMYRIITDPAQIGQTLNVRVASYGTDPADATPKSFLFTGRSQIEWQPLDFAGSINATDDWVFSWNPNPRLGSPLGPVQSTNLEGYRVKLTATPTYNPDVMQYDGVTGYYNAVYASSGNKVTLVARFKRSTFTGGASEIISRVNGPTAGVVRAQLALISNDHPTATRRSKVLAFSNIGAGGTACQLVSTNTFDDDEFHTVFYSYDGDTGTATLYIDGSDEIDLTNPEYVLGTATLDSGASSNAFVGAIETPNLYWGGDIGYLGYHDAYLTNWQDFMENDGSPKQLDETGWTEWGSQPLFWNDVGKMDDNKGSAGNMTQNGTITQVPAGGASGTITLDVPANQTTLTYTDVEQIKDFGALVTSWSSAQVMGLNRFTGEGEVSTL